MIFLAVGTQKFQFNRLLKNIDLLIDKKVISQEVIAQIGYSTYKPKNFVSFKFLTNEDYLKNIKLCEIFITHGGVGSILEALELDKKVIVFPRLKKYKEHIDDHQLEIAKKFNELNYILLANDQLSLEKAIKQSLNFKSKFIKKENKNYIEEYIFHSLKYNRSNSINK